MEPTDTPAEPGPPHVRCFVCSPAREGGLGARWFLRDGRVCAELTPGPAQQGPPGHLHGGAAVAVLDDGMGRAVWHAGFRALAARLETDFRAPVPLDVPLLVETWVERVEGRKVFTRGVLRLPDGSAAVESAGLFVDVPGFFSGANDPDR